MWHTFGCVLLCVLGILVRMTFESFDEALPEMAGQVGPPTLVQVAVAEAVGVEFPPGLPRLVAAARLRDHLSKALGTAAPTEQSDRQREYLKDLANDANVEVPKICTLAEAGAWIQHCLLVVRIRAHNKHRLAQGDLVRRIVGDGDAIDEVSSIDGEGRVWLRGSGGRLWPDQLEVVARAGQDDATAADARRIAANRRTASGPRMLTVALQRELEPFCPPEPATVDDLEGLRDVIDDASEEQPIQEYLDAHPQLLASILQGPLRLVRPQVRLGIEYVTDYMLADADSTGFRWIYVELETPQSPVLLKNGTALHNKARTGVAQIQNWREWIGKNLAYADRSKAKKGLGLPGIRDHDQGLVLVGRRDTLRDDPAGVRRRLFEDSGIAVRTYDWLLTTIEWTMTTAGPPPGTSHVLRLDFGD